MEASNEKLGDIPIEKFSFLFVCSRVHGAINTHPTMNNIATNFVQEEEDIYIYSSQLTRQYISNITKVQIIHAYFRQQVHLRNFSTNVTVLGSVCMFNGFSFFKIFIFIF